MTTSLISFQAWMTTTIDRHDSSCAMETANKLQVSLDIGAGPT